MIRDRYVAAIEAIAEREGVSGGGPVDWKIAENADRRQCLAYALRYVVRHRRPHYRYREYLNILGRALDLADIEFDRQRPLLHVDVGCGPGLFTWVVADRFRGDPQSVELHAYDHAPQMVRLAEEVWERFAEPTECFWHHDLADLYSGALTGGAQYRGPLVTFGHVLAQTSGNDKAIHEFAELIAAFDCDEAVVVAVDAKSAWRSFPRGCRNLEESLKGRGRLVDVERNTNWSYIARVRR